LCPDNERRKEKRENMEVGVRKEERERVKGTETN
jgi:hypothetical protein